MLGLYDGFRKWLRDDKAIGTDQMISDFLNYVDSYRWEATRKKEGFDVVFVDELHLFNRQERMLFRHLLRDPIARQPFSWRTMRSSPRAIRSSEYPANRPRRYDLWQDLRGSARRKSIELVDAFLYTPQIASSPVVD